MNCYKICNLWPLHFSVTDIVIDSHYGVLSSKGNRHYESKINMEQRHKIKLILSEAQRETKVETVTKILGELFPTKFIY